MVKQSAAHKKPVFIALKRQIAAINNHFCPVGFALVDIADNTVFCLFGNHWAHFNTRFIKLADFQRPYFWCQLFNKAVGGVIPNSQYRRYGHTTLASRSIGRTHGRINRLPHVGVGHDDHMIFCPAQRLYTLAVTASPAINIFTNGSRPDKADRSDIRVIQNCIYRFLVAINNIQTAVWKSSFTQQLRQI